MEMAGTNHGVPEQRRDSSAVVCGMANQRNDMLSVGAFGELGKKKKAKQALAVAEPEFAAIPTIKPCGALGQAIMTLRTRTAEVDIYACRRESASKFQIFL